HAARDALWATEQAVRSHVCGAVLAWPQGARFADLRRLQIAAAGGQALALLLRVPQAASSASPAPLRLALSAHAGGLAVDIFKRRGGALTRPLLLFLQTSRYRKSHALARSSSAAIAARALRRFSHPRDL